MRVSLVVALAAGSFALGAASARAQEGDPPVAPASPDVPEAGDDASEEDFELQEEDFELQEEDFELEEEDFELEDESAPVDAAASEGERGIEPPPEDSESGAGERELDEMRVDVLPLVDPRSVGGGVTVLDEEQLETLEYDDPHSILLQAPGVYVRTEDGFGLRPNIGLRGTDPGRSRKITLLEDGVLFGPAPYAAPAAYYFPLMTRITGVEIFKGPAAITYGPQTIGGAIDFRTRQVPEGRAGQLDLSFGSFRSQKAHMWYGASNRWGGILVEGLHVGTLGYKDIDFSNRNTGFSRQDFVVRAFARTDPSCRIYHRFEVRLGLGRERSDETYFGLTREDFAADPNRRYVSTDPDRMQWWRTSGVLTWRMGVGEHFSLVTNVYRHDFERSWFRLNRFGGTRGADANGDGVPDANDQVSLRDIVLNPTGANAVRLAVLRGDEDSDDLVGRPYSIDNDRRFFSQGVQTRMRTSFRTGAVRHDLDAGLRLHMDQVEREQTEFGFDMRNATLVRRPDDQTLVTDNLDEAFAFAGYLAWKVGWKGLEVTPGLRTEVIRTERTNALARDLDVDATDAVVLPGLGITYALSEELRLVGGVHRGFSPVAPGQDEAVDPELSLNYELGARYVDAEQGRLLELVGWLNDYSNLLSQCAFARGCDAEDLDVQFEGGDIFVWGIEAAAHWIFPLGEELQLPLRASYSYTDSRFQEDFASNDPTIGNVRAGDPLPFLPRHQGQLQLGLEHRLAGLRTVLTYVGEMRERAQGGPGLTVTDDFFLLDAVVWADLGERVRVYLRAENLAGQSPIVSTLPFGPRPLKPTTIWAGLRADLE
ncbi:MAG: TonB-dependent receptor [Myxococcota bacterium]